MAASVFLEDFQTAIDPSSGETVQRCSGPGGPGTYAFPAGWLLRNVDNRVPSAQVSYVNDPWEVRDDFALDVSNCVAFSTSFYSPVGTANDWMWTPRIAIPTGNVELSWRARSYDAVYPDSYEVRVMLAPTEPTGGTGIIGNQLTNSVVIYQNAAESASWATHSVDLSGYGGLSIRIGFRNNSNDKYLLVIDDVAVVAESTDLAAMASALWPSPYVRVPEGVAVDAELEVVARNAGTLPLSNVQATAQLALDGSPSGAPLAAKAVTALAPGASATMDFTPTQRLVASGVWAANFTVAADQSNVDEVPANDTIGVGITTIGDAEFARHGVATGSLGIGAQGPGELGANFALVESETFAGVRFVMLSVTDPEPPEPPSPWPGKSVVALLRAADANGKPGALIAQTEAVISSYAGGVYDVRFEDGPQTLAAGNYYVGVLEPGGSAAMPLAVSIDRFVLSSVWVNYPTSPFGDWSPLEAFGPSFRRVPNVSLLTQMFEGFKDGFEQIIPLRLGGERADGQEPPAFAREPQRHRAISEAAQR